MIRSTYRNLMLGILGLSVGLSFFLFRTSQDFQVQISDRENQITRLNQEYENAQSLNLALTELDNLTITEQTATQLDILRHLGLEQTDIDFGMESREVQAIGNTQLYTHNVRITSDILYEEALALCDRLQNTKKIVITGIDLTVVNAGESPNVHLVIAGKIYGLDKTLPAPGSVPVVPEPALTATHPALPEVSLTAPVEVSPAMVNETSATIVPQAAAPVVSPTATEQQ